MCGLMLDHFQGFVVILHGDLPAIDVVMILVQNRLIFSFNFV